MSVELAQRIPLDRFIRSILTHPTVLPIRQRLRAAWWALKGARTRNPPLRREPGSLLFVCLGNICRSPFAAERARQLVASAGLPDVQCRSAGIRPSQAARCPEDACNASLAYGVSLDEHLPQSLTRDLMQTHDLVVVMEVSQVAQLRALYPEFRDRIFLLSLFDDEAADAYERYHITDPFAQPPCVFEACYARIDRTLKRLLVDAFPSCFILRIH